MKNRIALKSNFLGKALLFILMFLFSTTLSNAQTVTFAQFFEVNGTNDFVFTNNTSSASFNTIANGSPVVFIYQNVAGLPAELQGPQSARFFITSTTTATASSNANRTIQPFNQILTIQIIRNTPTPPGVGTGLRTNLLTAVVTPNGTSLSEITGDTGGSAAAYTASTPNQIVTYTSDFINFTSGMGTERNLALSFSSVEPSISIGTGNFLANFTAAGSGTFASNPGPTFMPPTAASATISGRVVNLKGRGVANARVIMTDSSGLLSTARTNGFGYYRFSDVQSGQTVILTVSSKQYSYTPRVLNVTENLDGFDFIPQ